MGQTVATADIERRLREHADGLRAHLATWLGESQAGEGQDGAATADAQALVDALVAGEPEQYLPRFEAMGQRLAESGHGLAAEMAALHHTLDGLADGLAAVFAGDDHAEALAQARLARLAGELDVALVRGHQHEAERDEARARERAEQGMARLRALQRINAAANSAMDLGEILETVAHTVTEEMHADLCSVFLFDDSLHELRLRATNGPRPRGGAHFILHMGQGYTGTVAEHGQPLLERDASGDPRFAAETGAYPVTYRGLVSIPIIFFTVEKLVGVLNVQTAEPRDFGPEDVGFLEVVAGQLAMIIENGRLYSQTDEALRRKVHELNTLQHVSELVASTLEVKAVLETIVMQAVQLSGAERSILLELDAASQRLRPVATHGFDSAEWGRAGVLVGQCCAGRALQSRAPQTVLDCLGSDEGCFFRDHREAAGDLRAVLCVPLVSTHGAKGALCVYSRQRHLFSDNQLQLVETFANVAAIAMDNARLFEQTREGLETNAILVREMHHRVKNNLQQVGSILRMQRRRVTAPEAERILGESVGRIQGIAETHDLLSRESREQLAQAAIDEIVRKIVGVVQGNLVPPDLKLHIDVEPFAVYVPSEQATILAIVLNELIANAIEHGFAGRASGHIRVSGARRDGMLLVRVADNGVGPPEGFDPQTSDGLGLAVIRKLVGADLHGSFTVRRVPEAEALAEPAAARAGGDAQPDTERAGSLWTVVELAFPADVASGGDGDDRDGALAD